MFRDLNPGSYYARIILDANNNGIWDTGDYEKGIQPEMVCYSPKAYELKAFFEVDDLEPWVIDTTTLAKQKPLEITKQKPQEKEARRKQLEELERKQGEQNRGRGNSNNNSNNQYDNQMNMQQY